DLDHLDTYPGGHLDRRALPALERELPWRRHVVLVPAVPVPLTHHECHRPRLVRPARGQHDRREQRDDQQPEPALAAPEPALAVPRTCSSRRSHAPETGTTRPWFRRHRPDQGAVSWCSSKISTVCV